MLSHLLQTEHFNRSSYLITPSEVQAHLANLRKKEAEQRNSYEEDAIKYLESVEQIGVHSKISAREKRARGGYRTFYLRSLQKAKQFLGLTPNIVYAPGHGYDISHCEVFHNSKKIINLDINPKAVALMRELYAEENNTESHLGFVEDFQPEQEVDLMIVFSPGFDEKNLKYSSYLARNGYIITNSSCIDSKDKNLQFLGRFGENRIIDEEENHPDIKVTSDAGLHSQGSTGSRFANYADVLKIVYKLIGQTTNIVETYEAFRSLAITQTIDKQREYGRSPERKKLMEQAGIEYFEYDESDYRKRAKDLETRQVTLNINGEEITLKPLPFLHNKPNDAKVYKKIS